MIQLVGVQPAVSTGALLESVWHPEATAASVAVTSEAVVAEQQLRDSEAEQALTTSFLCAVKLTLGQWRAHVDRCRQKLYLPTQMLSVLTLESPNSPAFGCMFSVVGFPLSQEQLYCLLPIAEVKP